MNRFLTRALITTGCLIALAACGNNGKTANTTADSTDTTVGATDTTADSTDTTADTTATEAVRYETIGGCQMMGPNCATYVVYSDGTVEIYRTGENAPAEVVGSIPAAEITAFLDSIKDADFDGLVGEVGPGTCNACVDGLDMKVTITFSDGPVELDSTIVNFDLDHPLFANLETLMEDVRAVGELEIQQRM